MQCTMYSMYIHYRLAISIHKAIESLLGSFTSMTSLVCGIGKRDHVTSEVIRNELSLYMLSIIIFIYSM